MIKPLPLIPDPERNRGLVASCDLDKDAFANASEKEENSQYRILSFPKVMTKIVDMTLRLQEAAQLCGRLWIEPPRIEMAHALQDADLLSVWPLQDPVSNKGIKILLDTLPDQITDQHLEEFLNQHSDEHLRLFGGAGKTIVQANESVWLSRDHLVYGEQTIQVRAFYDRWGVSFENTELFPDDYLGCQLIFISYLLGLMAKRMDMPSHERDEWEDVSTQSQDAVPLSVIVQETEQFYCSHLARFAHKALEQLREYAKCPAYVALAPLTQGVLQQLESLLGVLIDGSKD